MRQISANSLSTQIVLDAKDEVIELYAGNPPLIRALLLPLDEWADAIYAAYGDEEPHRTGLQGMSATYLGSLVADQVGEDGQQHRFSVLTVNGVDVDFVVPANAYWRAQVRARGEGRDE